MDDRFGVARVETEGCFVGVDGGGDVAGALLCETEEEAWAALGGEKIHRAMKRGDGGGGIFF